MTVQTEAALRCIVEDSKGLSSKQSVSAFPSEINCEKSNSIGICAINKKEG